MGVKIEGRKFNQRGYTDWNVDISFDVALDSLFIYIEKQTGTGRSMHISVDLEDMKKVAKYILEQK